MGNRIPEDVRAEIRRLYSEENMEPTAIAEQIGCSYSSVYRLTKLQERFPSNMAYRDHLAQQQGFSSHAKYQESLVRQRGFLSYSEYMERLVLKRGFTSLTEYNQHNASRRSQETAYLEMGQFIKDRLRELGKEQKWLAEQLDVSTQSVSMYAQGKVIPRKGTLSKLLDIIGSNDVTRDILNDLV